MKSSFLALKLTILVIALLPTAGANLRAATNAPLPVANPPTAATATESAADREARLAWWREARFGMFIHWGPAALTGKEISWSRQGTGPAVYDRLYERFNPVKFDARAWVAVAKAAGMRYLVLTAKHHDGFMLWATQTDAYNIMRTPFGRDVVAELAQAARDNPLSPGLRTAL